MVKPFLSSPKLLLDIPLILLWKNLENAIIRHYLSCNGVLFYNALNQASFSFHTAHPKRSIL